MRRAGCNGCAGGRVFAPRGCTSIPDRDNAEARPFARPRRQPGAGRDCNVALEATDFENPMPDRYRFGRYEVRPAERQLLIDGRPTALGARAFDLLQALIERRDRVVGKNELLELIWSGVVVEENNLQVQVSTLRRVLGANAIATVPGRGYRFTQPLECTGAPALPEVSAGPGGASMLYGRDAELAELQACVARHRLVTVLGPGGIGKTRLVEALLGGLPGEFVDRSWKVDLASLADPALVARTVVQAIGAPAVEPASALALIVRTLADGRVLLVLDNCEHLLDAVDRLVAALRAGAPHAHIVVTSQELLRHPDEKVFRLGPLALPEPDSTADALASGAIALFVARAQAVAPRFTLNADNASAVVDICRRLDGVPLAIELAAARVPLLGVKGVRDKLDERFHILTGGARFALRRHQTLSAALEWSYGLLAPAEQLVFGRLGVFAGGFTLELAQALACDEAIDEWAVLDHLGALVDKSLVVADQSAKPRYRMLETTRAYALGRLAARGDTESQLGRHARAMLELFEESYADNLRGKPPAAQVERLLPELDNLRAALRWAAGNGADPHLAIALIGAAGAGHGFLWNAAIPWDGREWRESLKSKVDADVPVAIAARFWLACAELGAAGQLDEAAIDAQRALALYRAADDRLGEYLALNGVCYLATLGGHTEDAGKALDAALRLSDPSWPPRMLAIAENLAALYFLDVGQAARARAHLENYLSLGRKCGSDSDELTALSLMIDVDLQMEQVERAARGARELLADPRIAVERDDGLLYRNLATALMVFGADAEAESAFRKALPLVKRAYGNAALVLHDAATLLARRGRLDDAARVAAYSARAYAERNREPRFVARHLHERLQAQLASALPVDRLRALQAEGERLTDELACAIVFPALPSH